ncbi:MAG: hypothetical protein J0L92_15065 [Deltaproteobacteria bacterium]|nr:hypothetical protein [Deltaproteobacteria bacterium]
MKTSSHLRTTTTRSGIAFAVLLSGCGSSVSSNTTTTTGSSSAGHEASAPASFVEADVYSVAGGFQSVMPIALTSFGGAVLTEADGTSAIYVAGGYFGEPHRYSREGQSHALHRYAGTESAAPSWTERAEMDAGVQGLALVAHDGGLVRCGGSTMENAASEPTRQRALADCARYVPGSDAWETFPSLPAPRSSFDAVSVGDRIVAIGGWNVQGEVSAATFHETFAIYEDGAWREETAPFRRRALAVAAMGDEVIVVGGMNDDQSMSRETEIYDAQSNTWRDGPDYPGDAFGMAATSTSDAVYASGRDGIVHRLVHGGSRWEPIATLAEGRFFHRLFVRDGSLVAIGGIGSMTTDGRARLVEVVPLSGDRPRTAVVEIDYPGATRNRPGLFVVDDSLYLFGGNDSMAQHDFAPENFETAAFRLHLPSLRWFELPPLPEGRQSLVSVVHDGVAISVGGFGHDEDAERTYADAFVFRANEDAPSWQMLRDALPLPRTQFGMFFHEDALWLIGGLEFDAGRPEDQQFVHLASVLRCPFRGVRPVDHEALEAPASDRSPVGACEELTASPMPGVRRAFGSALLDGRLYVVGGMRDNFEPVPDCALFDLTSRQWSALTCPSAPRISPDLIAHEGKLYLIGGTSRRASADGTTPDRSGPDRSIEVFDPATSTWSTLVSELPFDTHQMRFVVHEHRILGVSTQATPGRATIVWIDVAR